MYGTPTKVEYHNTWNNPKGGIIYYFNIEFDNGQKGQFGSKEEKQRKFEVGKRIEYQHIRTSNQGTLIFDIVRQQNVAKSSYNNPENVAAMAMSVCQSAACDVMFEILLSPYKQSTAQALANKLYEWVISNSKDRDICSLRWNAILRSCKNFKYLNETDKTVVLKNKRLAEWIIEDSEMYMRALNPEDKSETTIKV